MSLSASVGAAWALLPPCPRGLHRGAAPFLEETPALVSGPQAPGIYQRVGSAPQGPIPTGLRFSPVGTMLCPLEDPVLGAALQAGRMGQQASGTEQRNGLHLKTPVAVRLSAEDIHRTELQCSVVHRCQRPQGGLGGPWAQRGRSPTQEPCRPLVRSGRTRTGHLCRLPCLQQTWRKTTPTAPFQPHLELPLAL